MPEPSRLGGWVVREASANSIIFVRLGIPYVWKILGSRMLTGPREKGTKEWQLGTGSGLSLRKGILEHTV